MDTQWHETRDVIKVISGKWVLGVLQVLHENGPLRHNELLRAAAPIGSTTLGENLRRLEDAGLVKRRVDTADTPPPVFYELTEDACELLSALVPLARWAGDR